jgi:hypothetical protein
MRPARKRLACWSTTSFCLGTERLRKVAVAGDSPIVTVGGSLHSAQNEGVGATSRWHADFRAEAVLPAAPGYEQKRGMGNTCRQQS